MYHFFLTQFDGGEQVGSQLRRLDRLVIKDTLVIQTPRSALFGYVCRSDHDRTFAEESINEGVDVLLDIDRGRIDSGKDYYEQGGWGKRFGENAMAQMGGHQSREWVEKRIEKGEPVKDNEPADGGRWPNNVIFVHDEGCKYQGTEIEGNGCVYNDGETGRGGYQKGWQGRPEGEEDGKEEVESWDCTDRCRARQLDQQSGDVGGKWGQQGESCGKEGMFIDDYMNYESTSERFIGDTGGASRFHYQAHHLREALEYLSNIFSEIKFSTPLTNDVSSHTD